MTRRLSLAAVLAVLVSAFGGGTAWASAFYNESESGQPSTALVDFSCGVFCHNDWSINAGDSASRPGKGGSFSLDNIGGFTGQGSEACDTGGGHPDTQDHGWAELHYENNRYQWNMYGSDQEPVSGSPFALELGTWQDDPAYPKGCFS